MTSNITEVSYYRDPKYSSVNKNNNLLSGANPFYLYLPGSTHLVYENNTGVGQKYVTISRNTLPSTVAETASTIAVKINEDTVEKKKNEFNFIDYNVKRLEKQYEDYRKEHYELDNYFKGKRLLEGEQGKYYIVNGEKYDEHFPYEWATNHLSHSSLHIGSGPYNCEKCKKYGSILDVFVGYCMDCHNNIYKGSRPGILDAVNTTITVFRKILPYMKDVRFINIGDRKGWTLLKEREQRKLDEKERLKKNSNWEFCQIQKRNDLHIRTRRNEYVSEEEWKDYFGSHKITKEDLFSFATSEY